MPVGCATSFHQGLMWNCIRLRSFSERNSWISESISNYSSFTCHPSIMMLFCSLFRWINLQMPVLHTTQNSSFWSHALPLSWGGTEHARRWAVCSLSWLYNSTPKPSLSPFHQAEVLLRTETIYRPLLTPASPNLSAFLSPRQLQMLHMLDDAWLVYLLCDRQNRECHNKMSWVMWQGKVSWLSDNSTGQW